MAFSVSAAVRLELEGLQQQPNLASQLLAFVGTPPDEGESALRNFVRSLETQARKALQAVGYYDADIAVRREQRDADTAVIIAVTPGKPVSLREIDIRIDGEARSDDTFQRALEETRLRPGTVLDHGRYERFKDRLVDLAQRRGYFDAAFTVHRVTVESAEHAADIELHFDSGIRYAFGRTTFDEAPITPELLPLWLPFEPGTAYDAELVAKGTTELLETGYFKGVRLITRRDEAADGQVPIHVELTAAPPNTVGLGIGFATDTGPRARATWEKPHVNDQGHSLRAELAVSGVRSSLGTSYRIPSTVEPALTYYQLEAALRTEDFQDTRSTSRVAAARRVHETPGGWQQDVYVRWLSESFEIDSVTETTTLSIPGIGWSRTLRSGGLRARQGARYALRLEGASAEVFSDINLQKVVASAKWLQPILDRHHVIARIEGGALSTNDFDRLPSSERFFTGGDQSVRGFAYRSIAPRDETGTLIGGRYLAVGSVEFVWHFTPSWGVAVFTDAGRAFSSSDEPLRVGAGFGLRWRSPIGTLSVDLGFGVSEDDTPARLHLLIGPEL